MNSTARICRYALFVAALFVVTGTRSRLVSAAMLGNCDEICTDQADCSTACLYNLDSEETCGDWGTCAPACGDVCGSSVSCDTACSGDGYCGAYNGGQDNGECYGTCGDGVCSVPYENHEGCSADCPACGTSSCSQDTDCTAEAGGGCINGCCMYNCGPPSPTCPGCQSGNSCSSNSDCCEGQVCASINGGSPECLNIQ